MPVPFEPTDENRRSVRVMSGFGVPQEDIALHLDIDPKTLRKHFRRELDRGTIEANLKVAQTLLHMATVDKNVAAAIFWLKARAGWREKHPDKDDAPPVTTNLVVSFMDADGTRHPLVNPASRSGYRPTSTTSDMFNTDQRPLMGGERAFWTRMASFARVHPFSPWHLSFDASLQATKNSLSPFGAMPDQAEHCAARLVGKVTSGVAVPGSASIA